MAIAANRYTTTELLADIRRKGHIPPNQTPFQDADLLAMADFELQTSILSQIRSCRENYFLTYTDFSISSDSNYKIPLRAIGSALSAVQLVVGTTIYQIDRVEISQQFSTLTSPNGFYSFYIQGNSVVVLPSPTTGTIRLWFYTRPNTLISPTAAAQVSSVSGNVITCLSVPTTFTTGTPLDIIKDQPGFEALLLDTRPTLIAGVAVTIPGTPTTTIEGDWVALAGQTPVPQIPVEFRPLLIQRVVVKYYESQGYLDKMKAAQAKLVEMQQDILQLINPRVAEAPKRVVADSGLIGGYSRSMKYRAT